MATKAGIKGIQKKNAGDFLGDLHAVLQKYNLDYTHSTITINTGEFSLTKEQDFVCAPGCTVRYQVIILPGGGRRLSPYCDCPG